MDDLLQSQIHSNCKLALPDGLKDLMWDISREVLRAQPKNLYGFITQYLSALLVTRENLSIASHICGDVCTNVCHSVLEDELRYIGLEEADVITVVKVIEEHFSHEQVSESNLMVKLVHLTNIKEDQLQALQDAVRNAFLRFNANRATTYETSSDSDMDEVDRAARHTLHLYKKTQPSERKMHKAALKIQTAYRAYGIRRHKQCLKIKMDHEDRASKLEPSEHTEGNTDQDGQDYTSERKISIRFDSLSGDEAKEGLLDMLKETSPSSPHEVPAKMKLKAAASSQKSEDVEGVPIKESIPTASSLSLAGSYMRLPKYKPYSAHDSDILVELEEVPEKEHTNIDYTLEPLKKVSVDNDNQSDKKKDLTKKAISFHDLIVEVPATTDDLSDDVVSDDFEGFGATAMEFNEEEEEAYAFDDFDDAAIKENVNEVNDDSFFRITPDTM